MLALKEFRSHIKGLPDLLNWGAMVDKGVLLNKDASFTCAFYYRGEDLGSSTDEEMTALSAFANAGMLKLGTGWLINVDSLRVEATTYPDASRSYFPDPTTRLIEAERQAQHETEGAHFDNVYALTFTFQVPAELQSRLAAIFVDDDTQSGPTSHATNYTRLLARYKDNVKDVIGSFGAGLHLRQMDSDELLTFLNTCLTGETHPVATPKVPMYLDAVLGNKDFYTGLAPRIGKKHVRVVSLFGFPGDSSPGIIDRLNRLPFEYRWSTRFIPLDPRDAEKRLNVFRRNWFQKRHGLMGLVKSAAGGGEQTWSNGDAMKQAQDADQAVNENSEGHVRYGYYTSVIVVMAEKSTEADTNAQEVKKLLDNAAFPSYIEDINVVEAFLGSLPAHGFANVRRPLIHTLNLADLIPLTAVWAGSEFNPCKFYQPKSPPLLYGATQGATPFRLSLHVDDLGHFGVYGPPGAGKSTLLNLLMMQHFRYYGAQVFGFDFGYSMVTGCEAAGGVHYDIAADDSRIGFCPLAQLDTTADRQWAAEFIELLVSLRLPPDDKGKPARVSIAQSNEILRAMNSLAADTTEASQRTITHFIGTVQDNDIKNALKLYTVGESAVGNLLDASEDALASTSKNTRFFVFEMSHLFGLGEQGIIPAMFHIFRQIEKRVSKSIPTLIPIDEAFRSFGHPLAMERLAKWLELMRKENAAVGFATQNLETLRTSPIFQTILNTVATHFMLPNATATTQNVRPIYQAFGLNDRQIENIAYARPKRDYYVMNADGRRMFDLGLGQIALAFVGVSGKEQALRVRTLKAQHGGEWVYHWLIERGVPQDWANYWQRLNKEMKR